MTMMTTPRLGPVSAHVRARLMNRLQSRRVVVWYDPQLSFVGLMDAIDLPGTVLVSAAESGLRARRDAEAAYRRLNCGDGSPGSDANLLIYVPLARGLTPEQRQHDPFEGFACCGDAFGDQEGEYLQALALEALPGQRAEIVRLFQDGRPSLELLDRLSPGTAFPLAKQALGSDNPVDVIVTALSRADTGERLSTVPGSLAELTRLIGTSVGLEIPQADHDWPAMRQRLGTYLLTSEFAFDLPGGLPAALDSVPHADARYRDAVLAIADRLRDSEAGRDAYRALAGATERDLRLSSLLRDEVRLGSRDTFPVQERLRFNAVVHAAKEGDVPRAQALAAQAESSPWRREADRLLLWRVVQRCIEFLAAADEAAATTLKRDTRGLIEAYCAADGLWRLDRAQRLFEYAAAQQPQDDEVEPLVETCRARYRALVERAQSPFQAAVKQAGWPPEGVRRQTQTFDVHVAPELDERRKTAYFLVDSLRYEMGRDLAEALGDVGAVRVENVATVLPTTTTCGMAALMPGADGAYTLVEHGGEVVPAIGGHPLPTIKERRALLEERYGDRLVELTLDEVLTTATKRLRRRFEVADLAIVRSQDMDELGENLSLYRARQVMSSVIGELHDAAVRLADLGFQTLVFAADHGHILVPEVLPGDVVPVPAGDWRLKKRRSLLGRAQSSGPGTLALDAHDLGIVGPPEVTPDFVVASGFKTFVDGAGYFHEGLSLQECLVPVVIARLHRPQTAGGGEQVNINYRSDRFTSSVVGLKLLFTSLFGSSLAIRLDAYDGAGPKANVVGQAADCDARNPVTGEVTLQKDVETAVPLVVDAEYSGRQIEVRATDPRTGAILARLTLKNDRLV
jgi:hypothetical protein